MKVPFVDLRAQYLSLRPEMDAAIQAVIDETAFVRGKYVKAFEEEYAKAYGVKHCISCANGTDAIYITLKMLGMGPGDEVITVANSWISTSETISQTGAKPVFVDIEPDYYDINTELIEQKITKRTRAILPVHLFGLPAEMDKITHICRRHGLPLVEDCAQAHFAEYKGRKVGTFGVAGTFSFYPGKNLGAYGDAGCIITDDDELARKVRMYANHGSLKKHQHEMEGVNSRMDGLQAAILSVKLPHIHDWNRRRHENAIRYNEALAGIDGVVTPKLRPGADHIFHVYCIRADRREALAARLKERGVDTAVHYPTALPFLKAYGYLGHKPDDFPVAWQYQREILSLPMFPELTSEQIAHVAESIRSFFDGR
ncbi:MAG: DegT/DnrJ/EryC1/StrS family aminotransferase [Phycisphaerae bacterium]|nr:DegT/DnrJ/EryC1/StrS family aminotransferase [Phycisphaerae bacterium]